MKKTAIALALTAALSLAAIGSASAADIAGLQSKADAGNGQAMYEVGRHYLTSGEAARGVLYLEAVIRSGDANAAYAHAALAKHYESMGGTSIARDAMMYHYRQAAVLGEVGSQVRLGTILLDLAGKAGTDISLKSQHQSQAQVLLEHAATAGGNTEAAFVLGKAYLNGSGVERDVTRAQTWLGKAADGNNVAAAYMLATHAQSQGDTRTAVRYLELAANRGHAQAMVDLASGFESGKLGEDLNAAKKWASKAVAANASGAGEIQAKIAGRMRAREESVAANSRYGTPSMGSYQQPVSQVTASVSADPQDEVDVLRHQVEQLQRMINDMSAGGARAREARVAAQQIALPALDQEVDDRGANEKGLEAYSRQDFTEAYRYFSRAARRGDSDAMNNMGMMLLQGQGVASDAAKAMEMFRSAAERGHVTAAHNIGYMYEYGMGVRQDIARSRVWYRQSAVLNSKVQRMGNYAGL